MGRLATSGVPPNWDELYVLAEPQGGYFTARQAAEAGIGRRVLSYQVGVGKLQHLARGIYRLAQFPSAPHDELIPIWLWTEGEGVFSHETALMLRNLSDILPSGAVMTVPPSWARRRLRVPDGLLLHFAQLPPEDRTSLGPLPVTRLLRTLNDCAESGVEAQFLDQAVREAITRGQLAPDEIKRLHPTLHPLIRAKRKRVR